MDNNNHHDDEKLVAEFCDSEFAARSRGFLILHAAQVVYIARMSRSTRLTAAFLSAKFKRKFSRRPIEDILKKVKLKEIVVTPEQLAAAARQHSWAENFAEMCPEALDPNSKMKIEDAPTPAARKAAMTKRAAKKAAKVEKAAVTPPKKPTETKIIEEVAAAKRSFENAGKIQSEEPNDLLDAVDAELRAAGIPFD
jgi:hypothetical protein